MESTHGGEAPGATECTVLTKGSVEAYVVLASPVESACTWGPLRRYWSTRGKISGSQSLWLDMVYHTEWL